MENIFGEETPHIGDEEKSVHKDMFWLDSMVETLQNKAGDSAMDRHFYLTLINNKLSQVASNMRVKFKYFDGGEIPANFYSFLLAQSGASKGKTNSTLEELFFNEFKEEFIGLMADHSQFNLAYLGERKARAEGIEEPLAIAQITRRYNDLPRYVYTWNDATEAGFKSIREKLTLAGVGSPSIELDEIGINMHKIEEFLSSILEVYDVGKLKQKLVKVDSSEDTVALPSTFLSFGTASSLLDGGEMEKKFNALLRQGMARRCAFSYTEELESEEEESLDDFDPMDVLSCANKSSDLTTSKAVSEKFRRLAKDTHINTMLTVPTDIWAQLVTFKKKCEIQAKKLSEFDDLVKLNLIHSYWTLSKLMSIYAFIDGKTEVEQCHYDRALSYVEESHIQFREMVKRKSNFERIASYITSANKELTLFDINDALPFYKSGNKLQKQEMLELAQAYAATHNMVIKHIIKEGIEYFSGSKLQTSTGEEISVSMSSHITEGFEEITGKWTDLHYIPSGSKNYSAHSFKDGYRNAENAIPGFNTIILDIDDGVDIKTAQAILEGQKYMIATTKSHQIEKNGKTVDRYRIFLPMKHTLKLNAEDFKKFMTNVMEGFPIEVDQACKDISRFYYPSPGCETFYGEGELFDDVQYIPDTSSNEKRAHQHLKLGDATALQKFFLKKMSVGNRNENMIRYALVLLDSGKDYYEVEDEIIAINDKLQEDALPGSELRRTILSTARKKFDKRQ